MKLVYLNACLALLVLISSPIAAALDLRKDLSESQFNAAGLSKLSAVELDRLQAIINREDSIKAESANVQNQNAAATAAPASSNTWKPAEPAIEKAVAFTSELDAGFSGRSGKGTSLKLANGQVWQQTDGANISFRVKDRRVRVRPAMFGWRLMFLQTNESVSVKRIQ